MINIKLECSIEINSYLKNYLTNNHLEISQELSNHILLIKEIENSNDILNLRKIKNEYYHVICVVVDEKYIFNVIDIHPISIWRKSKINEDCQELLNLIQSIAEDKSIIIEFQSHANKIVVDTKNIIYIESFGHYLTIHTINASFRIRDKISNILSQVGEYGIIQIHKSYLVNKRHIQFIHTHHCILSSDISIPIGKKYKNIDLS